MILEEFVDWESGKGREIRHVQELLMEPVAGEPEELIKDLQEIEAWNGRIGSLLAEANSWLDRSKMALKPDRETGTEFDRRIALDAATYPVRVVRDTLENLMDAIKQRLIMGESILSYAKQFADHKRREHVPYP